MTDHVVRAPVAGSVWKIEAASDDVVASEQTIIILESMKMEIPVRAGAGGTVSEILVGEGEIVEEGQSLARVKVSGG
ncbi:MAG: acetyl-CoA carboxylase biotin carboxyl carrier protein subunit [Alphaproteobacteria bacterium]|nr:acetyl-CoA carboxylase biotin carboxyl carrier protein subunit [Alphaproteobacteria bacterium]